MNGLGYRVDLEDHFYLASAAIPATGYGAFTAPVEIDHRDWLQIEDQLRRNSCEGNALASCGEVCFYVAANGKVTQFSRWAAYIWAQSMSGGNLLGRDEGATISGGVRAAKEIGFIPESDLPYPQPQQPYFSRLPAGLREAAAKHRIQRHASMKSYDDCFQWLASGVGAINIGIPWYASDTQCTGVMDSQRGQQQGYHALATVGYSQRTDRQGRKYLWTANSHGRSWGNNGWVEMAPALFDSWARNRNVELIGVTDMTHPEPRIVSIGGAAG